MSLHNCILYSFIGNCMSLSDGAVWQVPFDTCFKLNKYAMKGLHDTSQKLTRSLLGIKQCIMSDQPNNR